VHNVLLQNNIPAIPKQVYSKNRVTVAVGCPKISLQQYANIYIQTIPQEPFHVKEKNHRISEKASQ
jgi:hypothetical protein